MLKIGGYSSERQSRVLNPELSTPFSLPQIVCSERIGFSSGLLLLTGYRSLRLIASGRMACIAREQRPTVVNPRKCGLGGHWRYRGCSGPPLIPPSHLVLLFFTWEEALSWELPPNPLKPSQGDCSGGPVPSPNPVTYTF